MGADRPAGQRVDGVDLDPLDPGSYRLSSGIRSAWIPGVILTEPGGLVGFPHHHLPPTTYHSQALPARIGIVPVRVSDERGPIELGNLPATSSMPGHAMRWSEAGPCPLAGEVFEPCGGERGSILVLLTAHE